MRAVVIDPDPAWLEARRRVGNDRFDEVWDGVLHVVPPPSSFHQIFESDLEAILRPLCKPLGLLVVHNAGVFDPVLGDKNYRQPDISVVDPEHVSKRGIEARAELVIEILSPNDESRDKFSFYSKCGIPEVWLIDPISREPEVYLLRGGVYFISAPRRGVVEAPRFELQLEVADGPKLKISWADGTAEI